MKSKSFNLFIAIGAALLAGYWFWSPLLAIKQIQSAAQNKDAAAFNDRVDYVKLRESIKIQMNQKMAEKAGPKTPFGEMGEAITSMLVIQFVEAMVRPEVVMEAMNSSKFGSTEKVSVVTPDKPAEQSKADTSKANDSKWTYKRLGLNKVAAFASEQKAPDGSDSTALIFQRSGFATWKLSGIQFASSKQPSKQ